MPAFVSQGGRGMNGSNRKKAARTVRMSKMRSDEHRPQGDGHADVALSGDQVRPCQLAEPCRDGHHGKKAHTGHRKEVELPDFIERRQQQAPAV